MVTPNSPRALPKETRVILFASDRAANLYKSRKCRGVSDRPENCQAKGSIQSSFTIKQKLYEGVEPRGTFIANVINDQMGVRTPLFFNLCGFQNIGTRADDGIRGNLSLFPRRLPGGFINQLSNREGYYRRHLNEGGFQIQKNRRRFCMGRACDLSFCVIEPCFAHEARRIFPPQSASRTKG